MPSHGDVRDFDVVVIGAGPVGAAAAELGGAPGYSVALVERDIVGATVVTSGGAPTKTFREAAVYLSAVGVIHLTSHRELGDTCSSLAWFSSVWQSRSSRSR